jgi:hypothetical protein
LNIEIALLAGGKVKRHVTDMKFIQSFSGVKGAGTSKTLELI